LQFFHLEARFFQGTFEFTLSTIRHQDAFGPQGAVHAQENILSPELGLCLWREGIKVDDIISIRLFKGLQMGR
jgi:hypothetical protein